MGDRLGARPSQAPRARRRRRSGLVWAILALIAAGGLFAIRRTVGPATVRYRLEQIDRGPIRSEVTAPGTVSAVATVPVGSPVSGSVARLYGYISDLSRMEVRALVSEADGGRVAVGEAATLRCRPSPDCVSTGTVSEVRPSPQVSQGAGGYTVLVEADNHDHKLRLGMAATVSIEVARRDAVLRLPLGALRFVPPGIKPTTPTDPYVGRVFVLDHGQPRPVRVTVGLEDLRHAELVAGPLREGDAVIVDQE
jgi:multidrug efflux pump subunit AcrA (membrane-fusion protein)